MFETNESIVAPQHSSAAAPQSDSAEAPKDAAVEKAAPAKRKRRGVQFGPPTDEVKHVEQVTVRIRVS
jgi:hypothetical protein